ncbi:MAG: hypothetical protein AABY84_08415 [Candidatus Firestonebacteria bacterium]
MAKVEEDLIRKINIFLIFIWILISGCVFNSIPNEKKQEKPSKICLIIVSL